VHLKRKPLCASVPFQVHLQTKVKLLLQNIYPCILWNDFCTWAPKSKLVITETLRRVVKWFFEKLMKDIPKVTSIITLGIKLHLPLFYFDISMPSHVISFI